MLVHTQVRIGETDAGAITMFNTAITANCPCGLTYDEDILGPEEPYDFECIVPGRYITAQKLDAVSYLWDVNEMEVYHEGKVHVKKELHSEYYITFTIFKRTRFRQRVKYDDIMTISRYPLPSISNS